MRHAKVLMRFKQLIPKTIFSEKAQTAAPAQDIR